EHTPGDPRGYFLPEHPACAWIRHIEDILISGVDTDEDAEELREIGLATHHVAAQIVGVHADAHDEGMKGEGLDVERHHEESQEDGEHEAQREHDAQLERQPSGLRTRSFSRVIARESMDRRYQPETASPTWRRTRFFVFWSTTTATLSVSPVA